MRTSTKLAAFAAGAALVFGAAAAVGAAVGPIDTAPDGDAHDAAHDGGDTGSHGVGLTGLAIADAGYRLVPAVQHVEVGDAIDYRFVIEGPDGAAVTEVEVTHERPLHLIVASRDLVDFHHVHPELGDDGTWTIDLPPLGPGSYRVYADFRPAGAETLTLATDLTVAGPVEAREVPPAATASHVDPFHVRMSGADQLGVGEATLTFRVERDGEAVTTEPYLGAAGHLVVLRAGDLGYLHVHPLDDVASPSIGFAATFPTAGTYRLFLDFAVDGEVHTADFTVAIDGATIPAGPHATEADHGH